MENSRTWAIHLRQISLMYGMEDPLDYLKQDPPKKSSFKEYVRTKITSFHENELRVAAMNNSKMSFFNVSTLGLRGRLHPTISNITTVHNVNKFRIHTKMLVNDYIQGEADVCYLCQKTGFNNIEHYICDCEVLNDTRNRILTAISLLLNQSGPTLTLNSSQT